MLHIETLNIQYDSFGNHCIDMSMISDTIPRDLDELQLMIIDSYLKEKGLTKGIKDILNEDYPEVLI